MLLVAASRKVGVSLLTSVESVRQVEASQVDWWSPPGIFNRSSQDKKKQGGDGDLALIAYVQRLRDDIII
ncbi:hypothetical protein LXL04_015988 [Taraxacum kok-saghyz]